MAIQLTGSGHRVEVEELVGSGATSLVFRCRLDDGRRCALKVGKRATDRAIVAQEAERWLWAASHCLPELYGAGLLPGSPLGEGIIENAACLLLGWVNGVTLREYWRAHPVVDATILSLGRDLAGAIADLHAAGLAHGDIKPENVMVTLVEGQPRAVLLDLGLSVAAHTAIAHGGTRRYLAPESFAANVESDARARDLWALGMVLAEMRDPTAGERLPDAVATSVGGSGPLPEIIELLLAKCPGARPPASWVVQRLNALLAVERPRDELVAQRHSRVRRVYLGVRRNELRQAAHARRTTITVEGVAREWIERCLSILDGIDQMRALAKSDEMISLSDLDATSRLRFFVELIGPVAASWPIDSRISDARLLERLLDATTTREPHALTLQTLEVTTAPDAASLRSPVELALQLVQGPPRADVMDALEAHCLSEEVPVALRLTLGRCLRLVGQTARALAVFSRDASPACQAEAAETARRAGDVEGALQRAKRLDNCGDGSVRARVAATEARILLDQDKPNEALSRIMNAPDTIEVLEVRALAEMLQLRHTEALETLERARAIAQTDEDHARVSSLLGILLHATGRARQATDAFRRAVEYSSRTGALLEEATYLTGLAAASVDACRLDEAVTAAERATALFEALSRPERAARASLNRVVAFVAAGTTLQAKHAGQVALSLAKSARDDRCSAYIHLALAEVCDRGDALEHAQRAGALLIDPTPEEQLLLHSRGHDCGLDVDVAAGDALARATEPGSAAVFDWWAARARHLVRERQVAGAETVVAEILRLIELSAPSFTRGAAFSAGGELAGLIGLGDAARRLHAAALEDLQQLVANNSADLRLSLLARDWVKALHAPAVSPLRPEQIADIESLVRALGRTEQLRSLLVQVLDALVLWTGVERGLLLLMVPGGRLRARVGRNLTRTDLVGPQLELSSTLAMRALAQAEPIVAVDASGELDSVHASVHALKLRSVLAVPLIARGESLGVVYLDDRIRRGAFGEKELSWVRLVAAVAAVALADARDRLLLRRAARRAQRAEQRMDAMLSVREAELGAARLELARSHNQVPTRHRYAGILGNSCAMQALLRLVDRVVDSDVPVLLLGGSGTGKELIARAIHQNGARAAFAFVAENCGAIPESLLESALFGHVRGAFTGAARSRAGLFEVAHQGTLFLDEIAEMSLGMQTKLLRVLEEGEFWPVGSERSRRVDVRIIAATHRDLEGMVAAGKFRQDLFYRLNVIAVRIPALSERYGDVPLLVRHFISRNAGARAITIDDAAIELLSRHPWPGNVRQLENEIRRAIVMCEGVISVAHLSDDVRRAALEARPAPEGLELRAHVDALERELVTKALEQTSGNQTRAALLLGVSRFGLQKMMRRLEIRIAGSTTSGS